MPALDTQQRRDFRERGYLVVENLVEAPMIEAVRAEYGALMRTHYETWHKRGLVPKVAPGADFGEMLNACMKAGFDWYQPFDISLPHEDIRTDTPMHFGPAVFDMITSQGILDTVESLIGGEITSNPIQHVRIKPPQRIASSRETRAHVVQTDWHQDMGVTLPEADDTTFITVWLAITDATIENGCLQVAEGNHTRMLPHCTRRQVGLAEPFVPKGTAVPVPVGAGGAVIFHPFTPHASLANNSNAMRWSFDLRYNVTGQPTGRSQFPEFIARSRRNPRDELGDWREWKAMWEAARIRLAEGPHLSQHRWASDSPYCA